MAEKKRIARIGNVSAKGTAQVHSDDGLAQAENNLILDIMQSMNKSQIMSYQQIQEFKSKEKGISQTKSNEQNSCKQTAKDLNSKQIKKFVPEKTFPLMAKCQKSMKYLKKNRCIPKPRAHVGNNPKPPQKPISNLNLNMTNNHNDSDNRNYNESSLKIKQKSKRSRHSPETNIAPEKPKNSQTCRNSDKNGFQAKVLKKDPKFISSAETDSDDELEKFFQKHHPTKCKSNDSSDSSTSPRKKRKSNKTKKVKNKFVYLAERSKSKMTHRTLSESEESIESNVERNEKSQNIIINDNLSKDSCNLQIPSRRFHRIMEQEDSDSVLDTYMNNSGTLNYSSSNCSEDENINHTKDLDHSEKVDFLPPKSGSVGSSTSLSDLKDSLCSKVLPCYVALERDPLIEKKAASLFTNNLSVTNAVSDSCDDDCIIIETDSNFLNNNSENIRPSIKNSFQVESLGISKSPSVFEVSKNKQNKYMHVENSINSSNLESPVLEKQKEVNEKEASICESKMLSNTENSAEKEKCASKTGHSEENLTSVTLSNAFNVQILSVKSLNDCSIIVLSDDEENDGIASVVNETNEIAADDSDVEIICLDSSIVEENKFINKKISDVSYKETCEESSVIDENSSISSILPKDLNDEDCIILDIDNDTENTCAAKQVEVQQSSQINIKEVTIDNNDKKNSNNEEPLKVSDNPTDLENKSILNVLETIDFNSIKKVLNQPSTTGTISNSAKTKNPSGENIQTSNGTDSFSEKLQQGQNNACASIDAGTVCTGSEINKINNLKISTVNTGEKHTNLIESSHDMHNIKNESNPVKSNNIPSSYDKNPTFLCDNLSASNISVFKKEIATHKTDVNNLHHSQTNQLLPFCTKKESSESASDVLDILAAQSIRSLDEKQKKTILPLVDLYKAEYKKFMEIRCTEENVTAGLKLLEESQARKLMHISSSIKKIANTDMCFHKVKNEFVSNTQLKNCLVKTNESMGEIKLLESATQSSDNNNRPDDKVSIFNPSVVEEASEILKSQSVGSSSHQEVFNHLINSVCADCGKHPTFACSGCAKVFFCSEKCGISYWNKCHSYTCRR